LTEIEQLTVKPTIGVGISGNVYERLASMLMDNPKRLIDCNPAGSIEFGEKLET
jgi:hypothetical protein